MQGRLDYHHKVMSSLLEGKLHLAPLETPYRIVDIGTGTGIWAIDMADMYLGTDVIGNDLRYVAIVMLMLVIPLSYFQNYGMHATLGQSPRLYDQGVFNARIGD
jgi:2-polyprenyl-3-methyl-5-hydroxy-6-metoxy-1,4-benzoquinol methylase